MIVALTGTPTTGKSAVAERLAKITGWKLVPLNTLAEEKKRYAGYDKKRGCKIVDSDLLAEDVMKSSGSNMIIESHYAHVVPSDLVIVLRTNPAEMRKRAAERGWDNDKTEENVEAEIMEVCKSESLELGCRTVEIDTTGKSPEESAKEAATLMEKDGLFLTGKLRIPESMRDDLRKPYGKLFSSIGKTSDFMKDTMIISVGDQVSYDLSISESKPVITIIDGKINRKPSGRDIKVMGKVLKCVNETGYLTNDMWMRTQEALNSEKPVKIQVDGEEDMAVLAAMLLTDEGYSIVYGLFGKGVCVIKSGKETKEIARRLLIRIAAQ
ncbi:MAG: DUF359 domain-containing protein [Candidatus Aenigmarchaeota archaeon]|nr:DUF359 domain-containing protein [Candidatus Aenigmarchaeota archaeon]